METDWVGHTFFSASMRRKVDCLSFSFILPTKWGDTSCSARANSMWVLGWEILLSPPSLARKATPSSWIRLGWQHIWRSLKSKTSTRIDSQLVGNYYTKTQTLSIVPKTWSIRTLYTIPFYHVLENGPCSEVAIEGILGTSFNLGPVTDHYGCELKKTYHLINVSFLLSEL
jgi:hypothetical protein